MRIGKCRCLVFLAKTKESDKWGPASGEDLLAIIGRQDWTARHVVITGGEPCIHDLTR
ncbi:7-carboxy-7-deazaguanine synthase [Raoultella planticola]|uniref:7-carboxy-7-deazaguanine synthase n=1 Tax=Raoultella planticola TaxID=575 RepID=A0A485C6C5_RAOPL|nr:7-carboxy-7-deazaguanine synthase [Raoultella planticola]